MVVVEWYDVLLGVVLTGLSGLLTAIAWLASGRFGERRFRMVGLAFFVLAVIGALNTIGEFYPDLGDFFTVETVPLVFLVIAVGFLYLALLQGRAPAPGRE